MIKSVIVSKVVLSFIIPQSPLRNSFKVVLVDLHWRKLDERYKQ